MFATIGYYICIPFAWLLRALYELTSSYGWALVLFTVVIKLIMLPFQMKSKKSMMRMSRFQPMIKEIQTRYKNNQVKMNEELQRLYAEEGVNPMSGCLWSFLPFPILIALYSIIRQPITRFMMLTTTAMQGVIDAVSAAGFDLAAIAMTANDGAVTVKDGLTQLQPYGQITLVKAAQELGVALPEGWIHMDFSFLGMDLTMIPSDVIGQIGTGGWAVIGVLLIPIVSGALSFWQSKVSMAGNPSAADPNDPTARSSRMMMWMMPIMSLWIGFTLPASLGVYWIANSVLMLVQEKVLNKYFKKSMAAEDEAREKARMEDRLRRMEEARVAQQQRLFGQNQHPVLFGLQHQYPFRHRKAARLVQGGIVGRHRHPGRLPAVAAGGVQLPAAAYGNRRRRFGKASFLQHRSLGGKHPRPAVGHGQQLVAAPL